MKKYRHLINIGLLLSQIVPTIYLIYFITSTYGTADFSVIINFILIPTLTFILFKNKNLFTLILGLTLVIGNFTGLTAFANMLTYNFTFNIGSLPIPLYWGQPFYSVLLFIYILFNKDFYIGILTNEYWADFFTRTTDLELVFTDIKLDSTSGETTIKTDEKETTTANTK